MAYQVEILSAKCRQHTWFDILRAFLVVEGRGLLASVWRPLWQVGAGVAGPVFLVLAYCVLFRRLTVPEYDPPVWAMLLVVLGFSVFYGTVAGFLAGLVNAGRRLVGNKFFLLLPVVAVSVLITTSWFMPWLLVPDGKAAVDALSVSAANHGFRATAEELNGEQTFTTTRFLHLWPLAEVFACPFLVTDTPQVLVDGEVLWRYFRFLRAGTVAVLLGLIPSYLVSLAVLGKSGFDRLLARYRKFVADYGVLTRSTS